MSFSFAENLQRFRSKERAAFENNIARQERQVQDKAAYEQYRRENEAERLTPLSFEEWAKFISENDDPAIRGASASNRATWRQLANVTKTRIANDTLSDEELSELGFDLRHRPNWRFEYTSHGIAAMFERFRDREPRFVSALHLSPVGEFLGNNNLILAGPHIEIAFNLLWNMNLIQAKPEPVSEPEAPKVNLQVEPDPAREREQRRRDYFEKTIITHEGVNYTQAALDKLSATDFRRVMGLYGENLPRFSAVIKTS